VLVYEQSSNAEATLMPPSWQVLGENLKVIHAELLVSAKSLRCLQWPESYISETSCPYGMQCPCKCHQVLWLWLSQQ
jgi:hypothetical protein